MIKVLFLASNPDSTQALNLDEEIRSITEKLRASEYRDVLELVSLWAVRPDDLLQALNQHKPQIVHFSGHGSQQGEIILMDKNRQIQPVSASAIKMLFTTLKDNIRVVVLNACYSQTQATAISEVIDCVVGMDKAVGDDAAITFAASFYRAIGFGRSVAEAFDQGKTAIMLEGIPESNTPHLLTRAGIDASAVFLLDNTSVSISNEVYQHLPPQMKELANRGVAYIEVPAPLSITKLVQSAFGTSYVVCELRMRQTEAVFLFRVAKFMKIGDAAEYLAHRLLPHMDFEDYEWQLVLDNKWLPSHHTFETSGVKTGDIVLLIGNHKSPTWAPSIR